jgi:transcriptional regulator GlxA family with amidase domain
LVPSTSGLSFASAPIRDLLEWLPDHLTDDLSVPAMLETTTIPMEQIARVCGFGTPRR